MLSHVCSIPSIANFICYSLVFLFTLKKNIASGSPVFKNQPANAGDTGLIPRLGRFHMPRGN